MSKREMVLEDWPIDRLIPYEKNAKKHPKEQIQKIARSIEKHGLINPPNVEPDGTLITGHGRLLALKEVLGWKVVPVFVRYDLSKQEAAAARLADNKVGEGDYDTNILQEELRWLERESVDLSDLGFDARELEFLTADIGELDDALMAGETFPVELPTEETPVDADVDLTEPRVPITKVLGFKDVTVSQARDIGKFMDLVRAKFGDNPAIALASFADHEVSNA